MAPDPRTDAPLADAERVACETLAAGPGSTFGAVMRFLPEDERAPMLACEALFCSLRDIPFDVSDPAVGVAKLGWWQKELAMATEAGSQHPVVRALIATETLECFDSDDFRDYLHALVVKLQAEPPRDVDALRRDLALTAGQEVRVLGGMHDSSDPAVGAAAASVRLLDLLGRLARNDGEHPWIPMDLVARHRYRGGAGDATGSRADLAADLARQALAWRTEHPLDPRACTSPGARALALRDGVAARRLGQVTNDPGAWLAGPRRPGFGEVVSSWRLARRLVSHRHMETST